MRERIPIDTLLSNVNVGYISRVGFISDIVEAVRELPIDLFLYNHEELTEAQTYGSYIRELESVPVEKKDAILVNLGNQLFNIQYGCRHLKERNK